MPTAPVSEMLSRNKTLSETYIPPPPLRKLIPGMRASGAGVMVIACSDPRLNPYTTLGLDSTLKAAIILNAGGRAFDAIRSLAVLQTIGAPGTIVVMHHTDCGMTHFHDAAIRESLRKIAPGDEKAIEEMKFGEITRSLEDSVREDLEFLRDSPLIRKGTQLVGLILDVKTGVLSVVE